MDPFDGNFIENHARAIAHFADIAIIFVHSDELEGNKKYEIFQSSTFGYPEIRIYFQKPGFRFLQLEKLLLIYRYWKAQLKAYRIYYEKYGKPDLIHVHVLARSALLAVYLKKRKNIPYIISEHWSGYFKESGAYRGFPKKCFTKWAVRNSTLISTVSDYLRKAMQSHKLKGDYRIVPNVVATDVFKPSGEKQANEKKKIVHVSTLDVVPKNLPEMLKVIGRISSYRKDFIVEIYGDGPDRPIIEKIVDELKIRDVVSFQGNVKQQEVARGIADSDVLVLFSLYENQPCVMIESWSTGVPVIAPNIGGIPEHLNREMGILVGKGNLDELEKAINDILDQKRMFNKTKLREYAIDKFSEQTIGKAFLELYKEILKKNAKPILKRFRFQKSGFPVQENC